jgi:hypothetical protein
MKMMRSNERRLRIDTYDYITETSQVVRSL